MSQSQDPRLLITEAGLKTGDMPSKVVKALEILDKTRHLAGKYPENKDFQEGLKTSTDATLKMVKAQLDRAKPAPAAKQEPRKTPAKKSIMQIVRQQDEPELEACRERIRQYNKDQREANPKPPKARKTRITKLKEKLLGIIKLMPQTYQEDQKVIDCTHQILVETLHKLRDCWEMNRIGSTEKAIEEAINSYKAKTK